MKIICDESCTSYHNPGHPERPSRILDSLALFRSQKELTIDWLVPSPISDESILRAHLPEHIARLRVPHPFDADTFHFPEIEKAVRLIRGEAVIKYKEKLFEERKVFFADTGLFDVFSFRLLKGAAATALKEPSTIVITSSMAGKYFDTADPLNQILMVDKKPMKVTGVLQDLPLNSHLDFDFLI